MTTFTAFGFATSSPGSKTLAEVIIAILRDSAIAFASFVIVPGSTSGSSPWTLMTCVKPFSFFRATSATRSVPLMHFSEVITHSAPNAAHASAMRRSSVATITRETPFARAQRSHTCWIIGLPARGKSGFPGKRVDA